MVHLKADTRLPITLEDIHDIKKEAKKAELVIDEKSGKYSVYLHSKHMGDFSPNGTITNDTSGVVYDLLSSVVNNK